jgi:NTE family protein
VATARPALSRKPRLGIALGSGAARGWSHIGVLRTLEDAGFRPDIVCGTSIGALVGAAYAAGELERLEAWVRALDWPDMIGLLDLKMGGGLMEGGKLVEFLRTRFTNQRIDQLGKTFACVATDLSSGREIWLREGPVIDAVRASIALPGILTPVVRDGLLLVDGGLVNPVPVSLCRALGADLVLAVDLNWDLVSRHTNPLHTAVPAANGNVFDALLARLRPPKRKKPGVPLEPEHPAMLEVLAASLNIMQVRITQSRLAGEPADALIRPRLAHLSAMDFHRGEIAIDEGVRAAEAALPEILEWLGRPR